ncbi:MAG: hypothetical protein Fur005_02220 [Roseiflexaceae bacterium]
MSTPFDAAELLQICLDRIEAGASIEECLADYPEQRLELEPLLRAVVQFEQLALPSMPASSLQAIEGRMLDRLASLPPASSTPPADPLGIIRQWTTLLPPWLSLMIVVLVILTIVVWMLPTILLPIRPIPPTSQPTVIIQPTMPTTSSPATPTRVIKTPTATTAPTAQPTITPPVLTPESLVPQPPPPPPPPPVDTGGRDDDGSDDGGGRDDGDGDDDDDDDDD